MKKNSLLLALIAGFALTGCGNHETPPLPSEGSTPSSESLPESIQSQPSEHSSDPSSESTSVESIPSSDPSISEPSSSPSSEESIEPSTVARVTVTVINGNGGGTYEVGTLITVTPNIGEDEVFVEWQVNGECVSKESTYTFVATEDITLTAIVTKADPMAKYTRTVYTDKDEFRILNLTDIQLHDGDDLSLTFHIMDTLIEREKPDMIAVLGDHINDHRDYDVIENVKAVVNHLDSFDIPWAPVFGNHDYEEYHPEWTQKTVGTEFLSGLFKSAKNCLYLDGPSGVLGKSNYMVNVVNSTTNEMMKSLVFIDSKTHGVDATSVKFYEDAITYAKKLNGGKNISSVVFDHIPIQEYKEAYDISLDMECRDMVGLAGMEPLVCGDHSMFNKFKELGSTKTMICGHDHEDAYYTEYEGIKLAHAMKSSDGDDDEGVSFRHPLGGLVLDINGEEDVLRYSRVEDVGWTFEDSFPFSPNVLPYWQQSGAKLAFNIDLPSSGTLKFNVQGTNLMRETVAPNLRKGSWNRLTNNVVINADLQSVEKGTLTNIEGNKYHCVVDLEELDLNKAGGEVAYGDETARVVYFHHSTAPFTITDVHWEYEEITETDQIDLSEATIAEIDDVVYKNIPAKPDPVVTLDGETLVEGKDIIYSYIDNNKVGEATLKVIPSGKGAHRYKGEKTVTFNITENGSEETERHTTKFIAGVDSTVDLADLSLEDTLIVDFKFDDTQGHVSFMLGDGWNDYFGYYEVTPTSSGRLYAGVNAAPTDDGFIRVTITLGELSKKSGNPAKVNLFYIRGAWTNASGEYEINPDVGGVVRGTALVANADFTFSLGENKKNLATDILSIDFKFTSGTNTYVNLMLGQGWNSYFGYYKIMATGALAETYAGVTTQRLDDGYIRVNFNLSELNKLSDKPAPTEYIDLVFVRGIWSTAEGYIDVNPAI